MNLKQDILLLARVLLLCLSCQKVGKPAVDEYPDMKLLLDKQISLLNGKTLAKRVSLGSVVEVDTFQMDTDKWKQELSFFKDINPNLPDYTGVFEMTDTELLTSLRPKEGEDASLKMLTILREGSKRSIKATLHQEAPIYTHHQNINVLFEEGAIRSYQVDGYQKILLQDTIKFSITCDIL